MTELDADLYRGDEIIANFLQWAGLDARLEGGWVFVTHEGRELWIGAEYGQSLDASVRQVKS